MKKRLRTWNSVATPPVTSLTFIGSGEVKKNTENPTGHLMDTFAECYKLNIEGKFDSLPHEFIDENARDAYTSFSKKDSLKNLRYFENHYDCSGVCDVPLFFLTKSTSEGPPSEDCAVSIIHSMKGNAGLLALSLVGMLSFWWAALATVPRCCGKKKGKSATKGKHVELSEEVNTTAV